MVRRLISISVVATGGEPYRKWHLAHMRFETMERFCISAGLLSGLAGDMDQVATRLIEQLKAQDGEVVVPTGIWWWAAVEEPDTLEANEIVLRQATTHRILLSAYHHWERSLKDLVSQEMTRFLYTRIPISCDTLSMKQLCVVLDWWGLHVETMPSWCQVEDLRHIANTLKHGYGSSSVALYERHRGYFTRQMTALDPSTLKNMAKRLDASIKRKSHDDVLGIGAGVPPSLLTTGDPASLTIGESDAERLIRSPVKLLHEMKTAASEAAVSFIVSREQYLSKP